MTNPADTHYCCDCGMSGQEQDFRAIDQTDPTDILECFICGSDDIEEYPD